MAKICNNCGFAYNSDDSGRCSVCNNIFQSQIAIPPNTGNWILSEPGNNELRGLQRNQPDTTNAGVWINRPDGSLPSSAQSGENIVRPADRILEGRITHIERNDERPQTDIYCLLSKLLIGILIFLPYMGIFIISGCLSLAFAIIGFRGVSQLLNPFIWSTALFEFFELLVLRRIRGTDTVPIYRGIVEESSSQEHSFLFRGPLRAGNLIAGHNVRVFGLRERGTFVIRNGMDLTSNSEIVTGDWNPWGYIFYFLLLLYIGIGVLIYINIQGVRDYIGGYLG